MSQVSAPGVACAVLAVVVGCLYLVARDGGMKRSFVPSLLLLVLLAMSALVAGLGLRGGDLVWVALAGQVILTSLALAVFRGMDRIHGWIVGRHARRLRRRRRPRESYDGR